MDSILFPHVLLIYSIDTILYPYALPIITSLNSFSSLCLNIKIKEVGLGLFYFFFSFLFSFRFIFPFSIFRTTRVRVDWSHCHNSHLMAKSQDKSQDLGKSSRRFENKWCHTTWTPHVGLIDYTWLFRVGCTVLSMDHL